MGPRTNVKPSNHAIVPHAKLTSGPPCDRFLPRSTAIVTGLIFANACNHDGIVSIGTNAELRKVSGNTMMNSAELAVSTLRTDAPMTAAAHENAKLNPATMNGRAKPGQNPPWNLIPIISPTPIIRYATNRLFNESATILPAMTADLAIGNDR